MNIWTDAQFYLSPEKSILKVQWDTIMHISHTRNSKNEKNDNKCREWSGTSAAFYTVDGTT